VCSTWQKLFLVMGGAVLGFAGAILLYFLPIEVDVEIRYYE
jgi:hypothetical protein